MSRRIPRCLAAIALLLSPLAACPLLAAEEASYTIRITYPKDGAQVEVSSAAAASPSSPAPLAAPVVTAERTVSISTAPCPVVSTATAVLPGLAVPATPVKPAVAVPSVPRKAAVAHPVPVKKKSAPVIVARPALRMAAARPIVKTPVAAPVASAQPPAGAAVHLVKEGETLGSIARAYYNDENEWMPIYEANAGAIDKGALRPGQTLVIPAAAEKKSTTIHPGGPAAGTSGR